MATVRAYSVELNGNPIMDGEDMGLMAVYYGSTEVDTSDSEGADLDASFSADDLGGPLFFSQFGR